PKPKRRGKWWVLRYWRDDFVNGERVRTRPEAKLGPASLPEREALKIADELLRPLNQGLESIGSATNFNHYVDSTYIPVGFTVVGKRTTGRTEGGVRKFLPASFRQFGLPDLNTLNIQRYFSEMSNSQLSQASVNKIRDVLASILSSAKDYG